MTIGFAPPPHRSLVPGGGALYNGMGFSSGDESPRLFAPEDIIHSQELDPVIVLFFGRRGDGKTLCMSFMAAAMRAAYLKAGKNFSERHPDGFKLASNYHVMFSDFNDPHLVDMLSDADERYRRINVSIDEILSYLPSRRTMARGNLDFVTNCLVQIRKFDMEMLCTTQRPQNLDSQMLDQIDFFIMPVLYNKQWVPEKELWSHKHTGRMLYRAVSARLLIWDWWGTYTGKQYRKIWPPMMSGEPPDYTMDFHRVHELYSWYSSKEPIPAMWHRKREDTLAKGWTDTMTEIAQDYAPEAEEQETDGVPAATIGELIAAQPPDLYIRSSGLFDRAKKLDRNISMARFMVNMEDAGYTIIREGRYGYRAVRIGEE